MRRLAAALALGVVLAAPAIAAGRRVAGDMPRLPATPAAGANAPGEAAPVPDPDIALPSRAAPEGLQFGPSLTNRLSGGGSGAQGYAPGSAFSGEMDRKHRDSATNLGTILAPGLQLKLPLR